MRTFTSYTMNYYLHKVMALIIGTTFFGVSILGILKPDMVTVQNNGEVVEASILTLFFPLLIGGLTLWLFVWMTKKYFRVKLDESGIIVLKISDNDDIKWDMVESIKPVDWLWKGVFYKVIAKNRSPFYFHTDKPKMSFKDMISNNYKTEMAEFIDSKKKELGI